MDHCRHVPAGGAQVLLEEGVTGRRWLWVSAAAGLSAFLAVAVGLSVAAGGPGPGLAASAPPRLAASPHPTVTSCRLGKPCITAEIVAPSLTTEEYAVAQPRSAAILAAVSAIDWCAYPDHQPCRRGASLTPADVAIVRDTLVRAGFPDADVQLQASDLPIIRYTVPLGTACVTGLLVATHAAPIGHTTYRGQEHDGSISCRL
jgi:hypothetical protein